MKVNITIEQDDDDARVNMGISSEGLEPFEIAKLLLAGVEMSLYDLVVTQLEGNGGEPAAVAYAAPLRTRLLAQELLLAMEPTPYDWVRLDLGPDES